ncbi:39S ribosomal protein L41, mitochondrial [Armadillidium vulgare]|nr:39S ribosomal protein L41, mitochondrial [Armadillidium vulgare]
MGDCQAVDIYKSKASSEKEIITSIEDMKKKCMKRKEIISEKKTQMTSSLEVLDKCLAQLEELTVSEAHKDDTENVRKFLQEMDEDLKKTDDDEIINLELVCIIHYYLSQIYKRVQNEEKVFTVCKIEDEIKYGKVSKYENKLFFHSLSLSEVPTNSSLIWFEELKRCANVDNFYTFIEICCNKNNLTRMVLIKMFDKQLSHHFIRLCTGENGPSYKGASFRKAVDSDNFKGILHVENFIENGS